MPTPFFADLVRELAQEGGTGPLTPTGAVPGHRRFAGTVPVDAPFHYAVAGIAQPGQWETGLGHIDAAGRLVRDSVAASSAAGARVDFATGLKTIALTVGADWFGANEAAQATLSAAVADKQPLSTGHAQVATGASGDLLTVRRASGWVNVPLATLPYRDSAGRHAFGGALSAPDGSAGTPAISFAGDTDTGLFRPGNDALAIAAGGAERVRVAPDGRVGIGRSDPTAMLSILGTASSPVLGAADGAVELKFDSTAALAIGGGPAPMGNALWLQGKQDNIGYSGTAFPIALNPAGGHVGIGTGTAAPPAVKLHVRSSGEVARFETTAARGSGSGYVSLRDPSGIKGYFGYGGASDRLEIVNSLNADILFYTNNVARWQMLASGHFSPVSDNALDAGGAASRIRVIYAGTGTINTSDAREKTAKRALSPGEMAAARRIAAEIGIFRFLTGVRLHVGVIAQDIWAIMAEEGLIGPIAEGVTPDSAYAFLCYDEWDGDEATGTGNRFGIRPDQLALFLIAAQEQRIAALEGGA